jgi:hypothetical protein
MTTEGLPRFHDRRFTTGQNRLGGAVHSDQCPCVLDGRRGLVEPTAHASVDAYLKWLSGHSPPAVLPAATSAGDADGGDQGGESVEIVVGDVVPFGMFDPFADDLGVP